MFPFLLHATARHGACCPFSFLIWLTFLPISFVFHDPSTPLRRISVILGAYDIQDQRYQQSQAQTFSVLEKKIHPNFAFSASQPDRFDVALLRLDRHVRYQENMLPVCLPPRGWTFEGWRATVTGWGKTDSTISEATSCSFTNCTLNTCRAIIGTRFFMLWYHALSTKVLSNAVAAPQNDAS